MWRFIRLLVLLTFVGLVWDAFWEFTVLSNLDEVMEKKKLQRDSVKRVNEALVAAAGAGDYEDVDRLLNGDQFSGSVDPNYGKSKKGGSLFIIASVPQHRFRDGHLKSMGLLLKHPDVDPNGPGNAWAPLKAAVQNENEEVVKMLLQHPRTIPEVDVAGLGCNPVIFTEKFANKNTDLPIIKFILDGDTPKCYSDLSSTRVVSSSESRFRSQRSKDPAMKGKKQLSSSKKDVLLSGRSIDASDPFGQLPVGVLPDRSEFVMNPTSFDNIVLSTVYYFLGITVGMPTTLIGTISYLLWINVMVLVFVALFAAKHVSKTRDITNREMLNANNAVGGDLNQPE